VSCSAESPSAFVDIVELCRVALAMISNPAMLSGSAMCSDACGQPVEGTLSDAESPGADMGGEVISVGGPFDADVGVCCRNEAPAA
jgi:hypothetical protein